VANLEKSRVINLGDHVGLGVGVDRMVVAVVECRLGSGSYFMGVPGGTWPS
jgi:hypothetical protein